MSDLLAALNSSEFNEPFIEALMLLEILRTENSDLQARAEAAEIARAHWEARARIAEGRVAELERQLAALTAQLAAQVNTGSSQTYRTS